MSSPLTAASPAVLLSSAVVRVADPLQDWCRTQLRARGVQDLSRVSALTTLSFTSDGGEVDAVVLPPFPLDQLDCSLNEADVHSGSDGDDDFAHVSTPSLTRRRLQPGLGPLLGEEDRPLLPPAVDADAMDAQHEDEANEPLQPLTPPPLPIADEHKAEAPAPKPLLSLVESTGKEEVLAAVPPTLQPGERLKTADECIEEEASTPRAEVKGRASSAASGGTRVSPSPRPASQARPARAADAINPVFKPRAGLEGLHHLHNRRHMEQNGNDGQRPRTSRCPRQSMTHALT